MAGWLSRLVEGFWSLVPGTHEAVLEEQRVGAKLGTELAKPPGERDEERVRALRMDYRRRQLQNQQVSCGGHMPAAPPGDAAGPLGVVRPLALALLVLAGLCLTSMAFAPAVQAEAAELARIAASYDRSGATKCCAAAGWVRRRMAASYRALEAYTRQLIKQVSKCGREGAAKAYPPAPALLPTAHTGPYHPLCPRPASACIHSSAGEPPPRLHRRPRRSLLQHRRGARLCLWLSQPCA